MRRSAARFVWSLSLVAALVCAVPLRATSAPAGTPAPTPAKGDVVPAFEAQGLDGKAVNLAFPKGSKTVLVFFSSTCPICHRMIPEWNRAYKERKPGITMYGIVMDKPDPAFFIMTPIDFPVLTPPSREFLTSIKVQRVPTTLRIGPAGNVEDAAQGQIDRMRLAQFFAP